MERPNGMSKFFFFFLSTPFKTSLITSTTTTPKPQPHTFFCFSLSLFLFLGEFLMRSIKSLKRKKKKKPLKKNPELLKISLSSNTMEGEPTRPYPDIFTLIIGSEVNLDGIMLLSSSDGWILDYTVETSQDGVSWNLSATVKSSSVVLRFIRFDNGPLLKVKQLRVIITAAMAGYSRISELSPVYAVSNSTTNPPSPSTAATTTTTTTPPPTPSPVTSRTRSNTVGVIAGVLGGLAGILLGVLAYLLWLLRKQRKQRNGGTGVEGAGQAVAVGDPRKSPVSGFSFNTNVASELGGQHPESYGRYPRTELA